MKVKDIQERFDLEVAAGTGGLDREISGGYCGDLLSDVMANSASGELWLTIQSHQNIVAIAVLRELAGIILVSGRLPDEDTKAKADDEGIPILLSPLPAYILAGRLYGAGVGQPAE
jgi:predicted transcriptional regulator